MIDLNKVAIVAVKQTLEPAFADQPIKPSTFPSKDGTAEYLVYERKNGTKDAVIDTTQSQANAPQPSPFRYQLGPKRFRWGQCHPIQSAGSRRSTKSAFTVSRCLLYLSVF
jgi:hypothetical protein